MPHIHGVAWINEKWLKNFGITGYLTDHPEKSAQLADMLVTCQSKSEKVTKIKKEVQIHNHTLSCLKYNGCCRYGFPRTPSPRTFLTQPLPEEMEAKEKKKLMEAANDILLKARKVLDDKDIDENMSYEEFLKKIDTSAEDYEDALSRSQKGKVLVLKRDVKDRFTNNFNEEMLEAWNANMDIQMALDPFAIVSYIISYVNKDETQLTKFLKDALNSTHTNDIAEQLKALKMAFLTNRQVGHSEAVYKLFQGMKLTNSNIATLFVASGFIENRSEFYQKVPDASAKLQSDFDANDNPVNIDEDNPENNQEDNSEDNSEDIPKDIENTCENEVSGEAEGFEIEDHDGKYKKATTVHDRYSSRPECLEMICLAQFATSYTYAQKVPKGIQFDKEGRSIRIKTKISADGNETVIETKENSMMCLFNSDIKLPKYIKLQDESLGFMRARKFPVVMRIHTSKRKEGHEKYYSELLLFCHWRNEVEDFHRWFPDECFETYQLKLEELQANKGKIYPGEEVIELLDSGDFNAERPMHIFDLLDSQREQENSDDRAEGMTDDPAYKSFGVTDQLQQESKNEEFRYKVLDIPNDDELRFLTERLVPEQMNVLTKVVQYCKDVVKSFKNTSVTPEPVKLIVHGGAGKTNFSN